MKPFEKILISHIEKYPQMQSRDIIKLAMQSEYGNAHMISDEGLILDWLTAELDSFPVREDEEAFEEIGGKYVRLNLTSPKAREISPEIISKMFIISAREKNEDARSFESKLLCASDMAKRGLLPCSAEEFEEYLEYYTTHHMGEAVSHSPLYRELYKPSYRVILSVWKELFPVIKAVQDAAQSRDCVIVAIDGMAASGKSTAAKYLAGLFDAPIIHTDHFFLPIEMRTRERMDEVGGNLHRERFFTEVIENLGSKKDFKYKIFDCSKNTFTQTVRIPYSKVLIVEGAYSLHPYFGDYASVKVCMTVGAKTQSKRILERNGAALHERFINEWIPLENRYLKHFSISENCDIIINTD